MALFAPLVAALGKIGASSAFKGAAALIGTGATVASVVQTREASKEAEEANRLNRMQTRMAQARNIRRAVAATRVQQATVTSAATQLGTEGASGTAGVASSEAASTAGGVAFAGSQFGLATRRFDAIGRQQSAEGRAAVFGAIPRLTSAVSGQTPGQFFESIWDGVSKP